MIFTSEFIANDVLFTLVMNLYRLISCQLNERSPAHFFVVYFVNIVSVERQT